MMCQRNEAATKRKQTNNNASTWLVKNQKTMEKEWSDEAIEKELYESEPRIGNFHVSYQYGYVKGWNRAAKWFRDTKALPLLEENKKLKEDLATERRFRMMDAANHVGDITAMWDKNRALEKSNDELRAELSRLRSEGSHADVKRLVESAIRDTFNQVYYSHLHPEDYPAMTDVQWEDKWMAENFDKWRPLPEAPRDNNPITPNP
jgi:hypothetical protein